MTTISATGQWGYTTGPDFSESNRQGTSLRREIVNVRYFIAVYLLIVGFSALLPVHTQAQDKQEQMLEHILDTIRKGDIPAAEARADSALAVYHNFDKAHLAQLHTLRALLHDFAGNQTEVRKHFRLAIELSPDIKLSSLYFSPKLRSIFDEERKKYDSNGTSVKRNELIEPEIRYVPVKDGRVDASLRSLLVPGWGQFYKKQKNRGYFFSAATGFLLASATYSLVRERSARNDYLAETNLKQIDERYDTYNRYYRLRRNLFLASGVLWSLGFLDALITPEPFLENGKVALHLRPEATPQSVTFILKARW